MPTERDLLILLSGLLHDLLAFDLEAMVWMDLTKYCTGNMPEGRIYFGFISAVDKLCVFGGSNLQCKC